MDMPQLYQALGTVVIACPTLLLAILGVALIPQRSLSERMISGITQTLVTISLIASCLILALMLAHGERTVTMVPWTWVAVSDEGFDGAGLQPTAGTPASSDKEPQSHLEHGGPTADQDAHQHTHFHFEVKFVFDRLSVPFVLLTFVLCSTIGAFARSYMHREPGYRRFFLLFSMFLLGMIVSALAGSIETLFVGWELVGLSSALLVAFYHERMGPVRNALRVWGVYRLADAAFLVAAITLHRLTGEGDFAGLMGSGEWPAGQASMTPDQALFVGSLLLVAAAGKSALIPFSGWLPRAMEGPTPSSAIFYGALSVHLGVYLLLRISPILALSTLLSTLVIALGLLTAGYAALAGSVQTDIKSSLSFASLTQVGLIVAEVGCGWQYLALIHLLGHACLRTLQLVRAPSLLLDYQRLDNAVGARRAGADPEETASEWKLALYRFAYARGYLDQLLDRLVIGPVVGTFRLFDRWERRWTDLLSGRPPDETAGSSENGGKP